ncbi:TlpA family protein disulfide reductase [Winogradskyella psychrotolerans]|uniref:peroxiredoxin family protein n=1 Tax=Winogradskyella psychrotolerans TaxID=1344585 RepID=UPI001C07ED8F|nr:TlpA disulfide reductase family protein [Winogradskyella psychrotolerans]MBU2922207.1 TlpA family protein disulfide reductase [Winogradskyella psychrotolerans]
MNLKFYFFIILTLLSINTFSQEKNVRSKKQLNDRYKIIEKEKKELRKQIDGSILEELSFEDIDGNKHTLESLKGKIVVLNFWFIQCKPCVEEFPDLNKLKKKFKGKSVEFFAVTWNDKNSLINFLNTTTLDFTVVPDSKLIKKFKIPYYPYNIIIDKKGKIEYINDILSLNIMKKIERKINKLL